MIEEAAQEIFLKAFVQIKNYEARGSLEGWLTRSAKRQPELTPADLSKDENSWLEEKLHRASAIGYRDKERKYAE